MGKNDRDELADRLVMAAVRLTRWLNAADSDPQLSGPQASALAVIVHSGGVTPSELAALERVQRPAMARTLAQLGERGLVERVAHPDDGRSVMIRATAAGGALLTAGQRRKVAPLVAALAALPDAEVDALPTLLPVLERLVELGVGEAWRGAPAPGE
jgi:DNA-binding MarR family transcriptional regulator